MLVEGAAQHGIVGWAAVLQQMLPGGGVPPVGPVLLRHPQHMRIARQWVVGYLHLAHAPAHAAYLAGIEPGHHRDTLRVGGAAGKQVADGHRVAVAPARVADNLDDLLIADDKLLLTATRRLRLVYRQREAVGAEGARLPACARCGQVSNLRSGAASGFPR